jgi:hypothetical protein
MIDLVMVISFVVVIISLLMIFIGLQPNWYDNESDDPKLPEFRKIVLYIGCILLLGFCSYGVYERITSPQEPLYHNDPDIYWSVGHIDTPIDNCTISRQWVVTMVNDNRLVNQSKEIINTCE